MHNLKIVIAILWMWMLYMHTKQLLWYSAIGAISFLLGALWELHTHTVSNTQHGLLSKLVSLSILISKSTCVLGGKSFWKNFISSRDGAEKKYTNKTGLESIKNPTPLRNDAGPLSGLQRNALASLVHFVTHTTKRTRDAGALRWRPERGPALFRSGVGFLMLSNPVLLVYFFQLHPYSKWSFFRNFSPLVSVLFWGVSKPTFKIQLVSPPNSISHCRQRVDF